MTLHNGGRVFQSAISTREGRRTSPLLAIIVLLMCSLFSPAKSQTQGRYWEVLTLFGGKADATSVKTMVYDTKRDCIIIVGLTQERDLPVTPNAIKTSFTDMMDGYIAVFNGDCSELLYCSYLGGSDNDAVVDAILLDEDHVMVAVSTYSRDLPVTGTAWDEVARGEHRSWLAVLSLDTFDLVHAGYFGGSGDDTPDRLMKMQSSGIVLTGNGNSTDLPVTPDAFQSRKLGRPDHGDAWIAIFDTSLALTFCSYHGGAGDYDNAFGALAETDDYIVFSGETWSRDLPVTENAYQKHFADGGRGWPDAYLTIISKEDKRNVYTTYLGGSDSEMVIDIVVTHNDRIVLLGWTSSPDFPVTSNAWQTTSIDVGSSSTSAIIVATFSLRDMRFEYVTFIGGRSIGGEYPASGIYDEDRDVVRILATSGSDEFPFLEPKASNNSRRGLLLDFDVNRGVPIGAIPVVDFRASYMRALIQTETGRMLICGIMQHFPQTETIPVRPTGYKTILTGKNDVFIGEIYNKPVSLEDLAEPGYTSGALRLLNNPASNELRFMVEGTVPEASRAQLYDLLGRRVAEAPLLYNGRNAHGSMQIQGLAPGMYLLAIPGADGVRSAKVLVTK
jgi:hypothetical protein